MPRPAALHPREFFVGQARPLPSALPSPSIIGSGTPVRSLSPPPFFLLPDAEIPTIPYAYPNRVVLIVYDLPNRDCHAKASNGEICCTYNADKTCNYDASGDCSDGIKEYQTTYIDPLVTLFAQYNGKVPIVAVIEPDSLPNLATNQGDPHCGNSATSAAYKAGIPYAIQQINAKAPAVAMYLDAAHGGWLGWENNAQAFASLVGSLNVGQFLRGFSTNVANYQPLGTACQTFDWCVSYHTSFELHTVHAKTLLRFLGQTKAQPPQ